MCLCVFSSRGIGKGMCDSGVGGREGGFPLSPLILRAEAAFSAPLAGAPESEPRHQTHPEF